MVVTTDSSQGGLTLLVPVRADALPSLRSLLATRMDVTDDTASLVPFSALRRVHFLRWAILEHAGGDDEEGAGPALLFSSCFDGSAAAHLGELLAVAGPGLRELYSHCQDLEDARSLPDEPMIQALLRHRQQINALYIGTRGSTVLQIRRDADLYEHLQNRVDQLLATSGADEPEAAVVRRDLQDSVADVAAFSWVATAPRPLDRVTRSPRDSLIVYAVSGLLALFLLLWAGTSFLAALGGLLVLAVLLSGAIALTLRHKERTDPVGHAALDDERIRSLASLEDHVIQNQLTSVTVLKPGRFRLALLRAVLWLVEYRGRHKHIHGKLAGIPSIHYARWLLIDGNRRLLFLSNFDGSWENYLGEFVDRAASGLTGVWSNTVGFPRARWLFGDGARDEQKFKVFVRASQIPTQLWFSAYPNLTVVDIRRNARIRAGLQGAFSDEQTRQWLALL